MKRMATKSTKRESAYRPTAQNPSCVFCGKWLFFIIGLLAVTGCVAGNKTDVSAVKFEPSRKSTIAENIEAAGRVAGGAFDRLFKEKGDR